MKRAVWILAIILGVLVISLTTLIQWRWPVETKTPEHLTLTVNDRGIPMDDRAPEYTDDRTPKQLAQEVEDFTAAMAAGLIDNPDDDPAAVAEVGIYG